MDSQEDSQPSQGSVMTLTDENRHEVLYFAYGSNLSTAQMRQRCPYATPIGLGYLEGWRWIINERGFANVVRVSESRDASSAPSSSTTPRQPGNPTSGPVAAEQEEEGVYGLLYLLPMEDEERLDRYEGVPWAYDKFQTEVQWVRDESGRQMDETVRVLIYIDNERVTPDVAREEYVDRMERGIQDAVENWGMSVEYANRTMRRFWSY
jgi:hypothetical protein